MRTCNFIVTIDNHSGFGGHANHGGQREIKCPPKQSLPRKKGRKKTRIENFIICLTNLISY